jgi:hypothetical protein
MGSVPEKESPLFERFQNQGNVPLPEISNAPVHELGGSTRGTFGEVVLLEKQGTVPA